MFWTASFLDLDPNVKPANSKICISIFLSILCHIVYKLTWFMSSVFLNNVLHAYGEDAPKLVWDKHHDYTRKRIELYYLVCLLDLSFMLCKVNSWLSFVRIISLGVSKWCYCSSIVFQQQALILPKNIILRSMFNAKLWTGLPFLTKGMLVFWLQVFRISMYSSCSIGCYWCYNLMSRN